MKLSAGARLGPYEIIGTIGAGGMGEVFRARDTKLNRDVAVKVLPAAFADDPVRLARFTREAQTLASLNHPNIATIHGIEEVPAAGGAGAGSRALVMELVEGDDLSARIARGPISITEALPIARQIAEALEAAHEQGIIHRDLKPANIKVREDGTVKALDFGLAKALGPDGANAAANSANSPTLTAQGTAMGTILGTAAYMAPEQARGKAVDKRADIWAFGVVLYEMLTGERVFKGEEISDVLAAVLRQDIDWTALPADTPLRLRRLLGRCLDRDVRQRLRDIGEARVEIAKMQSGAPDATLGEHTLPTDGAPSAQIVAASPWRRSIALVGTAIAGAVIGVALWNLRTSSERPPVVTRFAIALPEGEQFTGGSRQTLAISPDGTRIAYIANSRLFVRSMSEFTGKFVPGTDLIGGVLSPVFSPDGQSIAFNTPSDNTLKRVALTGGPPATICPAANYVLGMTWGSDGIVFGQANLGILRVSPNGGTPETLVTVKAEELVDGPQMLPGGETLLFTLIKDPGGNRSNPGTSLPGGANFWDKATIVTQSLKSGERKVLIDGGSDGRYLRSGHLVFARAGVLFAAPFDLRRVEVTGRPVPILEGVKRSAANATAAAQVGISDTGSIVYVPGPASLSSAQLDLGLIGRNGVATPLKLPPAAYNTARVSPDGKQIAVGTDDGREAVVWIYDLSGTTSMRRLTFGGNNRFPIWSPDGQRVAFQSDREGDLAIFLQRSDGGGTAERITKPGEKGVSHIPEAWSPRGDTLLFRTTKDGAASLWTFSAAGKRVVAIGAQGRDATFSPDGRWIAYADGKRPNFAVYVQPFPATGAKYQISRETGGRHPIWSRDGKQILFVIPRANRYAAAEVTTEPAFSFANPEPATRVFEDSSDDPVRTFDITAEGRLVGVIAADLTQFGAASTPQIHVVLNWFEELKRLVPAK